MTRSKAIVTLAIGDHYQCQWEELCRSNWTQYADKHGYDLHCFKEPLDSSAKAAARSPSWQKCLILSADLAKRYEQIVWLDSDILINSSCAPCITSSVPVENVGGVNLWTAPGTAEFQRALFRLNEFWRSQKAVSLIPPCAVDYYISWGLPSGFNEVITASVLVLSPRHHTELLEHVYYAYRGSWRLILELRDATAFVRNPQIGRRDDARLSFQHVVVGANGTSLSLSFDLRKFGTFADGL